MHKMGLWLLHAGLVIAAAGCLLSAAFRKEWVSRLSDGQTMSLDAGSLLSLDATAFDLDPRGNIDAWSALVHLEISDADNPGNAAGNAGGVLKGTAGINRPWDAAGLRISCAGWSLAPVAVVFDDAGGRYAVSQGEGFQAGGSFFGLTSFTGFGDGTPDEATFDVFDKNHARVGEVSARTGDRLGPLVLSGFARRPDSLIVVSFDPWFPLIAGGLILCALGAAIGLVRRFAGAGQS
jgi:hypothetical protein